MWELRTLHMSFVLKLRLHFSQTGSLESGNLTLSDCVNPGGLKVKIFCNHLSDTRSQFRSVNQVPVLNTGKQIITYPMGRCLWIHHLLFKKVRDNRVSHVRVGEVISPPCYTR